MPGIQAVVFDIGNVLVEWNPVNFYDRRIGADRRRRLFAEVPMDAANERSDLGADMATEIDALAAAYPDWHDEIQLWKTHWLDMCAPEISRSSRVFRALRAKGIPVYALSNFGVPTLEIAEKAYPVLTEFDQRFISGERGVMKPDPAFYQMLEDETGVAPEALLFADDRPDNIEVASKRGWQTHLFTGADGWAARLVQEGLLSEDEAA